MNNGDIEKSMEVAKSAVVRQVFVVVGAGLSYLAVSVLYNEVAGVIAALVVAFLLYGLHIINQYENGVVLTFGKYAGYAAARFAMGVPRCAADDGY